MERRSPPSFSILGHERSLLLHRHILEKTWRWTSQFFDLAWQLGRPGGAEAGSMPTICSSRKIRERCCGLGCTSSQPRWILPSILTQHKTRLEVRGRSLTPADLLSRFQGMSCGLDDSTANLWTVDYVFRGRCNMQHAICSMQYAVCCQAASPLHTLVEKCDSIV